MENGHNTEVLDTCRLGSLEVTFEAQEIGINRKHRPNLKWATSSCFTYRHVYVSNPPVGSYRSFSIYTKCYVNQRSCMELNCGE
jgi:hypothetical protein